MKEIKLLAAFFIGGICINPKTDIKPGAPNQVLVTDATGQVDWVDIQDYMNESCPDSGNFQIVNNELCHTSSADVTICIPLTDINI